MPVRRHHRRLHPTNTDASDFAAPCRRCRVLHGKAGHPRRRRPTDLARRALGDLFTGP